MTRWRLELHPRSVSIGQILFILASLPSLVIPYRMIVVQAFAPLRSTRNRTLMGLPRNIRQLTTSNDDSPKTTNIGIIGGGLAGLSTAFHILQKAPETKITILDKENPGFGGASSVAGGFLHPLSPKGKLVHLGLEGLSATNILLEAATRERSDCVLRDEIFRLAVTEDHMATLRETAKQLPELSEWIFPEDLPWEPETSVLGSLRLHSGCKVVHMPTYLQGLWEAIRRTGLNRAEWVRVQSSSSDFAWTEQLDGFDTVILCAGSGLFQDSIIEAQFPIQLVRGQSIELTLNSTTRVDHAMLCGKYISPLMDENRVLVGATHEFEEDPLEPSEVKAELLSRSNSFASRLWEEGSVDKITTGFRVQSNRGNFGRMPIIGRFHTPIHYNTWIFTGLSSRGLLYHGVFGEILANTILGLDEIQNHEGLDWWESKVK